MINDINKLFSIFLNSIAEQEINLEEIKVDFTNSYSYYISNELVNNTLETLFDTCSSNQYCFTVLRDQYAQIKVILFDKITDETLEIVFFTTLQNKIKQELEEKYKKRVEFLRKLKIFPVIGPDGVGKTTLLTQVMDFLDEKTLYKRFKKIVRRSVIYNILYPINKFFLTKKLGKKPEKDQHDDIHFFLIICAGLGYYPYLIFQALFKHKLVFLDRFFYDYLLEDISFREKNTHLRKNWKFLLKFIPMVYWCIHLDADAKIILERKNELSTDDIDKYRKLNFQLYMQKPSIVYTYINTGLELEQCKNILLRSGITSNIFKNLEFSCQQ